MRADRAGGSSRRTDPSQKLALKRVPETSGRTDEFPFNELADGMPGQEMQFLNPRRALGRGPETEIAILMHVLAAGAREADGHGSFFAAYIQTANDVRRA